MSRNLAIKYSGLRGAVYWYRTVVTKHLKNIFSDHELVEHSVCAKFAHTGVQTI